MVVGIKPMLDLINPEVLEPEVYSFGDRPPRPDRIMERCGEAWTRFKEYTRSVAFSAAGHALAVVRSLYPSVKLEAIDGGFARGTTD